VNSWLISSFFFLLLLLLLWFPSYLTGSSDADGSSVHAPMSGTVKEVMVKPGDKVVKNQPVAVIVAMKLEVGSHAQGRKEKKGKKRKHVNGRRRCPHALGWLWR
jgi:hypothetical protein